MKKKKKNPIITFFFSGYNKNHLIITIILSSLCYVESLPTKIANYQLFASALHGSLNRLGWWQGRREGWARGGRCPPELPKFLLIITVHCIEMYYLPPLHKRQKKLSYLLLHVSELNNLN